MKGRKAIAYLRDIDELGEFKFIFNRVPFNELKKGVNDKYFVEAFFNPKSYGNVDFLVGYYVHDMGEEIEKFEDDESGMMEYYIDCARISCECAVEFTDDIDGMYCGLLMNYFGYTEEAIDKIIKDGESERNGK